MKKTLPFQKKTVNKYNYDQKVLQNDRKCRDSEKVKNQDKDKKKQVRI